MRSLLDALQEGRLIEIPDVTKDKALEYLAHLIEAVPDIGDKADLTKEVMDREVQFNTGIGKGIAIPHCRTSLDGELLCAVGWSPKGIDYNSSDGVPVHLMVMYYVPDRQRNMYLKEISTLAKVFSKSEYIESISHFANLSMAREKLLDLVGLAINESLPDSKARMIKLDARQASIESAESPVIEKPESVAHFIPFRLISFGDHILILSAEAVIVDTLEHADNLRDHLNVGNHFEIASWKVVILSETVYTHDRKIFDAVAYKSS
jgi:mannitol/fructose-specific phosphotransferase system IIA component (Ntr-type)